MNKPILIIAEVFLPALLFLACASSSRIDTTKPLIPDDVITMIEARNAKVRSLSAHGKISIETPEVANTGNISLKLLKPDSVLIEITGPFGMSVARGLVTNSNFTFYNGLDNTVVQGSSTPRNLRSVLQFPVEFNDIIDILSGSLGFNRKPPNVTPQAVLEGNMYRIIYPGQEESIEYTIDLSFMSVKRFIKRSKKGEILEDILFKDFRKKSDIYVPSIVTLSRPLAEENLTLVFDRQTLNDLPLDFTLKIPKSATKIAL